MKETKIIFLITLVVAIGLAIGLIATAPTVQSIDKPELNEKWTQQLELIKSIRNSAMLYMSWALVLMGATVAVIEGEISFFKKTFGKFRLALIPFVIVFLGFSVYYGLSVIHTSIGFLSQDLIKDFETPFKTNYWNLQYSFFCWGFFALVLFLFLSVNFSSIERKENSK